MANSTGKLQTIFHFDSLFSALSGGSLVLLGYFLGPLMVPDISPLYLVTIGVGLLPWALFNRHLSKQTHPNPSLIGINLTGDILWIAASILGLVFAREWLTGFGIFAISAAALIVAEFAWLKFSNRTSPSSASTVLQSS